MSIRIFTEQQLAEALNNVKALHEMAPELIAESVFAATLSPAHIEDGEEVDFAQAVTEKIKDAYHERESITDVAAAIVAQHQRILAARVSKAAPRVEDEREAFEVYAKSRGWDGHHLKRNADNPDRYDDWGVQPEWLAFKAGSEWRAVLSAPPAAGVNGGVDPCPGCKPGGVCRTPTCGRLVERSNRKDGINISDAPPGFRRPVTPPAAPPAAGVPEDSRTAIPADVLRDIGTMLDDAMSAPYPNSMAVPDHLVNVAYWMTYGRSGYAESAAPTPTASEQRPRECTCVYATAKNTAAVRNGSEMGGYLKAECEACQQRRQSRPASEQQRAVGLDVIDKLRLELLPEYEAGYTAIAYGDSDQPVARADGMTAREAIAELLRLNPHLANGEAAGNAGKARDA